MKKFLTVVVVGVLAIMMAMPLESKPKGSDLYGTSTMYVVSIHDVLYME